MQIVVLTGSPHKNGTTNLLAEQFISGAEAAGHDVYRFDSAFKKVHPCIGCEYCECGKKPCVFKDDAAALYPKIIDADLVAFVTPLYYHGYSAQLKAVIDRFHGIDDILHEPGREKQAVLLAAGANPKKWIMDGLVSTYHTELRYLGWEDAGRVLAYHTYDKKDMEQTVYSREAYRLGRHL